MRSDGGIVVSIAAFQAVDPGSIPGHRICAFDIKTDVVDEKANIQLKIISMLSL